MRIRTTTISLLLIAVAACGGEAGRPATPAESDLAPLLERFAETALRIEVRVGEGDGAFVSVLAQDPAADRRSVLTDTLLIVSDEDGNRFCTTDGLSCLPAPDRAPRDLLDHAFGPIVSGTFLAAGFPGVPTDGVAAPDRDIAGRPSWCWDFTAPASSPVATITRCIDAELGFTTLLEEARRDGTTSAVMAMVAFGVPGDADFPGGTEG